MTWNLTNVQTTDVMQVNFYNVCFWMCYLYLEVYDNIVFDYKKVP